MDYSRNQKYYLSTDTLFYVGLAILGVGAGLVVMGYMLWIYLFPFQEIVGLLLAVAGGVVAFAPKARRSSEEDIDAATAALHEGFGEATAAHFGFATGASANTAATVIGGYELGGSIPYCKRGKDSKLRSSVYTVGAVLLSARGKLYFSKKTVSLTEEGGTEEFREISLATVEKAEVKMTEQTLLGSTVKTYRFVITAEGEEVLSLPTGASAILDSLCENILREAERAKEN